jgi:DNA-binding phage protein
MGKLQDAHEWASGAETDAENALQFARQILATDNPHQIRSIAHDLEAGGNQIAKDARILRQVLEAEGD